MCENPKVGLLLKTEYDEKFKKTGKRSSVIFCGYLNDYSKKVVNGDVVHHTFCSSPLDYYEKVFIPCGQCMECRLQKSKERAGQAYAEYKTSNKACFLTLTFGDLI